MRTRREKPRKARKAPSGLPGLLPRFRRGELSVEAFFAAAGLDFERLAANLIRGWDIPYAVASEDVAQELRTLTLKTIGEWDPARCDLARFVIFKASDRAKRWVHAQRGAEHQQQGKQPSRHPLLLLDACDREGERESMLARYGDAGPTPEELCLEQERARKARLLAVAMGMTVEDLGAAVERDPDLRARAGKMLKEMGAAR